MLPASAFDFSIPGGQIATRPRPHHDHRLLAYNRQTHTITPVPFSALGRLLPPESLIVINNSKVVKAAIKKDPDDGNYIQVLNPQSSSLENVAIPLPQNAEPDDAINITGGRLVILAADSRVALCKIISDDPSMDSLQAFLSRYGVIPLPTYVGEERLAYDVDESAYEVCYARVPGSLACPTAGLHFTPTLMHSLETQGHQFVEITLHIGYGSWGSVQTAEIGEFDLDAEEITVDREALQRLWQGKREGRPIIAIGTTCVRTLESIADEILQATQPGSGIKRTTNLFIHPPYQPRVADALLTDFAYPQTPVMIMSAAFCGLDEIKQVYNRALDEGYMFDIFGDALLML